VKSKGQKMKTATVCVRRRVVTLREWLARTNLMDSLIALLVLLFEDAIKKPVGLRSNAPGH
jgi:hypothetical protein